MRFTMLLSTLLFVGCGDDSTTPTITDSAVADSTMMDAMSDAQMDTTVDNGFGKLVGTCGTLDMKLDGTTPEMMTLHYDLADDGYDETDSKLLSSGAQEILKEGTAGGSSGISEALAFEFLSRCEGATLLKSETEIVYEPADSKKTDMLVDIDGEKIGVSVTRAFKFSRDPENPEEYTLADAERLEHKLDDILVSSANVSGADAWKKQVLFVFTYDDSYTASIMSAWNGFDDASKADTIMYVVVTDGDDDSIYFNN